MFFPPSPPYIILSAFRFTGMILSIMLYAKDKHTRFKYMIIGWFFSGLGPIFQGYSTIKGLLALCYGLFVLIGTVYVFTGIILEFKELKSIYFNFGALILTICLFGTFFFVSLPVYYIILVYLQAIIIQISIVTGTISFRRLLSIGGKNGVIWFYLNMIISEIQILLFIFYTDFMTSPFSSGINYLIALFFNLFIISVEYNIKNTQMEEIQAKLLQAQKMEAIGRLAGGVAHDFNNILTIINGISEMILESKTCDEEEVRNGLKEINDAGQRAVELTKHLLLFSRKNISQSKVINLKYSIERFETLLRRLIGEDIMLNLEYEENLYNIECDLGHLEQILMNLAVNSRDAMPKGGELEIKLINYHPEKTLTNEEENGKKSKYILISVTDSGAGMNQEQRSHLFEPYYTTKGIGRGTGLGLSTVYGIVKQYDGEIEVESEIDHGTTFRIYLPASDKQLPSTPTAQPNPKHELPKALSILVVEDEEQLRSYFQTILEAQGFTVFIAGNPEQALERVKNHQQHVDVVLCDIILPTMNGVDLVDMILKIDSEIKVIFMSGYSEKDIVEHEILDKGLKYLVKPFSSTTLFESLYDLFES